MDMTGAERPAWVDDALFPFESRFVEIDGHRIHYVDEGSGPTLRLDRFVDRRRSKVHITVLGVLPEPHAQSDEFG
jgi:hypothetical protein